MIFHPHQIIILLLVLMSIIGVGCSGKPGVRDSGGYYGGDLPPDSVPVDPNSVPDAVPRHEPLSKTGNSPYTALGKRYRPLKSANGYLKRGYASWYGKKFHGRRTSSGEPYDMFAMTAAHPVLPLPSYVRVTSLDSGKSVVVKVNDRGPFLHKRIIDLSYVAAYKLGIAQHGTGRVEVRAIDPDAYVAKPTRGIAPVVNTTAVSGYAGTSTIRTSGTMPAVASETIMIQIGAYSSRDNALNMRQLLSLAGYQVAPISGSERQGQEQSVYRVRVGPFKNDDEANLGKQKLESMLGHPVAVVRQ